jgi:hypothetical protein
MQSRICWRRRVTPSTNRSSPRKTNAVLRTPSPLPKMNRSAANRRLPTLQLRPNHACRRPPASLSPSPLSTRNSNRSATDSIALVRGGRTSFLPNNPCPRCRLRSCLFTSTETIRAIDSVRYINIDVHECALCFERYHGMTIHDTRRARCHNGVRALASTLRWTGN